MSDRYSKELILSALEVSYFVNQVVCSSDTQSDLIDSVIESQGDFGVAGLVGEISLAFNETYKDDMFDVNEWEQNIKDFTAKWVNPDVSDIAYLGSFIKDSGNGDGYVLIDINGNHCGNYNRDAQGLLNAKKGALFNYLAHHEDLRSILKIRICTGNSQYLEFHKLQNHCEKAGITLPSEIRESDCINALIMFNGEVF